MIILKPSHIFRQAQYDVARSSRICGIEDIALAMANQTEFHIYK